MGMLRWVNHTTQSIQSLFPFDIAKYVLLACVVIAWAVLAWYVFRNPRTTSAQSAASIFSLLIVALFAAVCLFGPMFSRAHVILCAIMALAAVVQIIKLATIRHALAQGDYL